MSWMVNTEFSPLSPHFVHRKYRGKGTCWRPHSQQVSVLGWNAGIVVIYGLDHHALLLCKAWNLLVCGILIWTGSGLQIAVSSCVTWMPKESQTRILLQATGPLPPPWTSVAQHGLLSLLFSLWPLLCNTALEKFADDVSAREPLTRQLSIRKIREMKLRGRQPAGAPSEQ